MWTGSVVPVKGDESFWGEAEGDGRCNYDVDEGSAYHSQGLPSACGGDHWDWYNSDFAYSYKSSHEIEVFNNLD